MSLKQPTHYPVKYYSNADVGAPQLANADGAIKNILKACLVTGYGEKTGAGWTSLFDDSFRIILRRPLLTGNPPDIKVENGVINGAASHRVVSQDNPTGLNDATELAAVNLLARDPNFKAGWHLIVSDFGFWFGYQMADNGYAGDKNHFLYCGGIQKIIDADPELFVSTKGSSITKAGTGTAYVSMFMDTKVSMVDMATGVDSGSKRYVDINKPETFFNGDYLAQKIVVLDKAIMPFLCAIPTQNGVLATSIVSIANRPMLRYVNKLLGSEFTRTFYIPLDYWEL